MGRHITVGDARRILERGAFGEFIGVVEDEVFEAKETPYFLENDRSKYELAKDISGMANAGGGAIVLGLRTARNVDQDDEVDDVRPFSREIIHFQRHHDVLRSWTFPSLEGVEIAWFDSADGSGKGVAGIFVAANSSLRPFLITRIVSSDGAPAEERMCAYVERRRAGIQPFSVYDIQAALRLGHAGLTAQISRLEAAAERLEALTVEAERRSANREVPTVVPAVPGAELDQRVRQALQLVGLEERPAWILTARPVQRANLADFLDPQGRARALFAHPPSFRQHGFGVAVPADTDSTAERLARRTNEYKALEVHRDGVAIFIATAGGRFLAWNSPSEDRLRLNPLVIVESLLSFCTFYSELSQSLAPLIKQVTYTACIQKVDVAGTIEISPYPLNTYGWEFGQDDRQLPNDISAAVTVPRDTPAESVAFALAAELYAAVGFTADKVPYQTQITGERQIDRAVVANGGRPVNAPAS